MIQVFIDGAEGTTGLQLEQKLAQVEGICLQKLDNALRKDEAARKDIMNQVDVVFLCLPDGAAVEAVTLVENPHVMIIDASTAHRTHKEWAYGFPELSKAHYDAITVSNRIAVPGCYPTGFCGLVYPLIQRGLLGRKAQLNCFALSGYSGGGKNLIAKFEGMDPPPSGARPYGFSLHHKHIPEMKTVCGLETAPVFLPVVASVRQGMLVTIPLQQGALPLWEALRGYYDGQEYVTVMPFGGDGALTEGFLEMDTLNNTNQLELFVFGHETQALLVARLDNLGKGASGAALQCMKLRMGL